MADIRCCICNDELVNSGEGHELMVGCAFGEKKIPGDSFADFADWNFYCRDCVKKAIVSFYGTGKEE